MMRSTHEKYLVAVERQAHPRIILGIGRVELDLDVGILFFLPPIEAWDMRPMT